MPVIHILPQDRKHLVETGTTLMEALRQAGICLDAPCGGHGQCGKCIVLVNGSEMSACKMIVDRDITVVLPQHTEISILHSGICPEPAAFDWTEGCLLAFDIGTTTLVCYLLDGQTGRELAKSSALNPQCAYGADVISRIQAALQGKQSQLTDAIRDAMKALVQKVCAEAQIDPAKIFVISVVGNPAMQQLFLGIDVKNLASVPFAPVLTKASMIPCQNYLPICPNAELQIVPNLSGYIGADTIGCLLATDLHKQDSITLLVDIGTNGEMVLGNKDRLIACSTAAGPALEGANIRFGMRAAEGAIDHVWLENGALQYSVIGGGKARGICGSGLIDAIAVGLDSGLLNKRGKLQNNAHTLPLTGSIYLTQEDIRQVQLAKGAIYAGIVLMAKQLGITVEDIQTVQLAGAFGSFLNPASACRIGLLPEVLLERIETVGNAAGSGAEMLARDKTLLALTQKLTHEIVFLELASLPEFPKTFAKSMLFREGVL